MAGCKVVTRKLTAWHGRDEEFSNVYYFGDGGSGLSPDEETALSLLDAVIASEKTISTSDIKFLGGAVYKVGIANTPGDTDAIATRELVGSTNPGTATASGIVYRETAVGIKYLLGGRRYLRNLIHCATSHGYDQSGSGNATPVANLSAALKAYAEKMLNGPWPGGYQRIAPNGDRPSAIEHEGWLNHRQFHRYRRRDLSSTA